MLKNKKSSESDLDTVEVIDYAKQYSFRIIVNSFYFDAVIVSAIIANCVLMALTDPTQSTTPNYITIATYVFNGIFIAEMVLKILANSLLVYLKNPWHIIDMAVVFEAISSIIMDILNATNLISSSSGGSTGVSVIRVVRVLRPVMLLNSIPEIKAFVGAAFKSTVETLTSLSLLIGFLIFYSTIGMYNFSDELGYRCVNATLVYNVSANNSLHDYYYNTYGTTQFYPSFNMEFCGSGNTCSDDKVCYNALADTTVTYFSYKNGVDAFMTNLVAITFRGWGYIFWAFADSVGFTKAYIYLTILLCVAVPFLLNNFPAILYNQLRRCEYDRQAARWYSKCPIDKSQLTELEISTWAYETRYFLVDDDDHNNDSVTDKLELGLDDATVEIKARCFPTCRPCDKLREWFIAGRSPFNLFVNVIIICNVILLSTDSSTASDLQIQVTACINYFFLAVYMAEVIIKIVLLGPYLYFTSPSHIFDFILVLISIITDLLNVFKFLANFRIIRLFRILRLHRLLQLVNIDNVYEEQSRTIGISKFFDILLKLFRPTIYYVCLLVLWVFVFSLLGMQLFGVYSSDTNYELDTTASQTNTYQERLNFDSFPKAFITLFVAYSLDSWYVMMWNTADSMNSKYLAYGFFIAWIFVSNWFLQGLLLASSINIMRNEARTILLHSGIIYENIIANKIMKFKTNWVLKHYFKLFKNNVFNEITLREAPEGQVLHTRRREVILREVKEVKKLSFYAQFLEDNKYTPLYITPKIIQRISKKIIEHPIVEFIVNMAVLVSILIIVGNSITDIPYQDIFWFWIPKITIAIFYCEMGLKWLAYGLFTEPLRQDEIIDEQMKNEEVIGYFRSPFNTADFVCNILTVIGIVLNDSAFNTFRVIRIVRAPMAIRYIFKSRSADAIVDALVDSFPSLFFLVIVCGLLIYFFGIVGLQLWSGKFGHCSDTNYPSGRYRYETDSQYPYGCGSSSDAYNSTLYWTDSLDNFNDISYAMQSVLRIVIMNEWHSILFQAIDNVSDDYEPKANQNRAAFFFFFLILVIAFLLSCLYIAVIFYHFTLNRLWGAKKVIHGVKDAFWIMYEVELEAITFTNVKENFSDKKIKEFVFTLLNSKYYIGFLFIITILPLFFVAFSTFSAITLPFDTATTLFYIVDFSLRFCSAKGNFISRPFRTKVAIFELIMIIFLVVSLVYISNNNWEFNKVNIRLAELSAMLRFGRFLLLFPNFALIADVIGNCVSSFLPLSLYGSVIIVVYCVIGVNFMPQHPDFGDDFSNNHFLFKDLFGTLITLMTVVTGNGWTGFINTYASSSEILGVKFFIYFYFLSFYIVFETLRKTFCILIISKYQTRTPNRAELDMNLIDNFQDCWGKVGKNRNLIDISTLRELLLELKRPLGLGLHEKSKEVSYLMLDRFVKKVLFAIPKGTAANSSKADDWGRNPLLTWDEINRDFKEIKEEFTFDQILRAVHKNAIIPRELPDEGLFKKNRLIVKQRLAILQLRLVHEIQRKLAKKDGKNDSWVYILQRFSKSVYRHFFITLMTNRVTALRERIESQGFSSFESYTVVILKKTISEELNAVRKQKEITKRLRDLYHVQVTEKFHQLYDYEWKLEKLHSAIQNLYDSNVVKEWRITSMIQKASLVEPGKSVSAVTIDEHSTLFIGYSTGELKIFRYSESKIRSRETGDTSTFQEFQKLHLKSILRNMVVTPDGQRLYAACGNEIVVVAFEAARKTRHVQKKAGYRVISNCEGSGAPANCVFIHNREYFGGFSDGSIYLWSLGKTSIPLVVNAGSAVYCMCALPISSVEKRNENPSKLLACGTSSGTIFLLHLKEIMTQSDMKGISVSTGSSGISSIRSAWSFLYTGSTTGTLKVWAVSLNNNSSRKSMMDSLQFVCVCTESIHNGPITAITSAGGHVFTVSHDMGFIAWTAPNNIQAKTALAFKHSNHPGLVLHEAPIITMASNSNAVVTGDENGKVIFRIPTKFDINFKLSKRAVTSSSLIKFSFMEHNFGYCFIPLLHQPVTQEEITLTCHNPSSQHITIRSLYRRISELSVEIEKPNVLTGGLKLISIDDPKNSHFFDGNKWGIVMAPGSTLNIRILFSPVVAKVYSFSVPFLFDETDQVNLTIHGTGVKPKLDFFIFRESMKSLATFSSDMKFVDTEVDFRIKATVKSDDISEPLELYSIKCVVRNPTVKGQLIQCLGEVLSLSDESFKDNNPASGSLESFSNFVDNLSNRGITITPRSFYLEPKESKFIVVSVRAKFSEVIAFNAPVIFSFAGGHRKLFTVTVRKDTHSVEKNRKPNIETGANKTDDLSFINYPMIPLATVCPANVLELLCQQHGWLLTVGPDQALAYHPSSGVFLDFCKCESTSSSPTKHDIMKNRQSSKESLSDDDESSLYINIDCRGCNYFEVRMGNDILVKHGVLTIDNVNRSSLKRHETQSSMPCSSTFSVDNPSHSGRKQRRPTMLQLVGMKPSSSVTDAESGQTVIVLKPDEIDKFDAMDFEHHKHNHYHKNKTESTRKCVGHLTFNLYLYRVKDPMQLPNARGFDSLDMNSKELRYSFSIDVLKGYRVTVPNDKTIIKLTSRLILLGIRKMSHENCRSKYDNANENHDIRIEENFDCHSYSFLSTDGVGYSTPTIHLTPLDDCTRIAVIDSAYPKITIKKDITTKGLLSVRLHRPFCKKEIIYKNEVKGKEEIEEEEEEEEEDDDDEEEEEEVGEEKEEEVEDGRRRVTIIQYANEKDDSSIETSKFELLSSDDVIQRCSHVAEISEIDAMKLLPHKVESEAVSITASIGAQRFNASESFRQVNLQFDDLDSCYLYMSAHPESLDSIWNYLDHECNDKFEGLNSIGWIPMVDSNILKIFPKEIYENRRRTCIDTLTGTNDANAKESKIDKGIIIFNIKGIEMALGDGTTLKIQGTIAHFHNPQQPLLSHKNHSSDSIHDNKITYRILNQQPIIPYISDFPFIFRYWREMTKIKLIGKVCNCLSNLVKLQPGREVNYKLIFTILVRATSVLGKSTRESNTQHVDTNAEDTVVASIAQKSSLSSIGEMMFSSAQAKTFGMTTVTNWLGIQDKTSLSYKKALLLQDKNLKTEKHITPETSCASPLSLIDYTCGIVPYSKANPKMHIQHGKMVTTTTSNQNIGDHKANHNIHFASPQAIATAKKFIRHLRTTSSNTMNEENMNLDGLAIYFNSIVLPGLEEPLDEEETKMVMESFPNNKEEISLLEFISWFRSSVKSESDIVDPTPEMVFSSVLEEDVLKLKLDFGLKLSKEWCKLSEIFSKDMDKRKSNDSDAEKEYH